MGQPGTNEQYIADSKSLNTVAHELRAATLVDVDKFYFGVIMPTIIKMWYHIVPNTKGTLGGEGDFQ